MQIIDAPKQFDKKEYNKTEKARAMRSQWRAANVETEREKRIENYSTENERAYLNRRFVPIDGEGITDKAGKHLYVLLAIKGVEPLINKQGLSTLEILDYLWGNLNNRDINIIYGGGYDFNLWVRDLINSDATRLYKRKYTGKGIEYLGYELKWLRGKNFSIRKAGRMVSIFDVLPFFQSPFITACDDYLGEYEGRDILVREKARRSIFTTAELKTVAKYNQLELDLLERLATELRARLYKVRLRPRRWDGPGAIAAALFTLHNIKSAKGEIPEAVAKAARFGYAGGRFEMIKYGGVKSPVYEYDINSAYPAALRNVPNLSSGIWERAKEPGKQHPYALYHVEIESLDGEELPNPLYCRGSNGSVSYPSHVINWIWSPEYEALLRFADKHPCRITVKDQWSYDDKGAPKPFAFIDPLYKERQHLKAIGDGAHVGIKLALNSMYGKTAQQVGWIAATDRLPARLPPFHQLEWAGYVTSACRAKILDAITEDPTAIIAIETDAIFSTKKLALPISSALGEWSLTEFESLTYVQSGHYYGTKTDGEEIVRCRGVDRGSIAREQIEAALKLPQRDRYLKAPLTRFMGLGIATARGFQHWCQWETEEKSLAIMPTGKRVHAGCCDNGIEIGEWHKTICPIPGGQSAEYPVEWINPNPDMSELSELREAEIEDWE